MAQFAKLTISLGAVYDTDYIIINKKDKIFYYRVGDDVLSWNSQYELYNKIYNDFSDQYYVSLVTGGIEIIAKKYGDDINFTEATAVTPNGSVITLTKVDNINPACNIQFLVVTPTPEWEGLSKGKIELYASNATDILLYSIDGVNYTEEHIIEGLDAGIYTVYAKDPRYSGDTCIVTDTVEIELKQPYVSTKSFTQHCGQYFTGSYTATVTAISTVSQEDADAKALEEAEIEANTNIVCTVEDGLFENVPIDEDSFCISYSFIQNNWCLFHDYLPDQLFSSRSLILSFNKSKLYRHNVGPNGVYYDGTIKPFFLDFVLNGNKEHTKILDTIMWLTQVSKEGRYIKNSTFDYISIWNDFSASGKIEIDKVKEHYLAQAVSSDIEGHWVVNEFDDIVSDPDSEFVSDFSNDYIFINENLDKDRAWFDRQLMSGKYFIVRLEFSNESGNDINLIEVTANLSPSYR